MVSRASRVKTVGLPTLALLGTVGTFVFGDLASKGPNLLNILPGAICAAIPVSVTAINRFLANRQLKAEVGARETAVRERELALLSKQHAVRLAADVQVTSEARLIFALRARLSPVLYCLGKIAEASSSSGAEVAPLIGSLTQAIVSAAIEHQFPAEPRRSIFFALNGDLMDCAGYAGYEGKQDAALTVFTDRPDDPVGRRMYRLLDDREALLIPDVEGGDLPVQFPSRRSFQTIIATAVMAGDCPYGVLTLDAPKPDSLGQPDLEIMKTLASLLGVGLALADQRIRPAVQIPAPGSREVVVSSDLLASVGGTLWEAKEP
jgi:hypothetical protein